MVQRVATRAFIKVPLLRRIQQKNHYIPTPVANSHGRVFQWCSESEGSGWTGRCEQLSFVMSDLLIPGSVMDRDLCNANYEYFFLRPHAHK